ncbi:hypothetical protein [Pseudonocardia zijingensis]|uniref:DUF4132 domain-containing protein n=1 Tax=Pseudonocardia zijingensis TaxID=153376 RepID=A0ABP4BCL1_9PSEU
MIELAIAVSDRPMAPHQYRFVETHAWWLGTFGPHQHLTEHRLRQWIPAQPEREWVLERELTGAQTWLTGSAEEAREDGFDLYDLAPVGRFRARYGEFDTVPDPDLDLDLGGDLGSAFCPRPRPPRRGSWQSPTPEFLGRLPRDPAALLDRLREENPGSWFGPFAAAVTALRTALVPAELRSAFFRALTALPGVSFTDDARNVDGHECLALVHDAGRTRTELFLDPADGQFAGERDTLRTDSRAGLRAGTVISTTAVRTAVVDAEGELPAA